MLTVLWCTTKQFFNRTISFLSIKMHKFIREWGSCSITESDEKHINTNSINFINTVLIIRFIAAKINRKLNCAWSVAGWYATYHFVVPMVDTPNVWKNDFFFILSLSLDDIQRHRYWYRCYCSWSNKCWVN